jgi:glycogen debranching enzyme
MDSAKLRREVARIMRQNFREKDGHRYTIPSPASYPYQWLWDSCFHAIILTHFDINAAKEELLSLITHQFENGMLPHMVYWDMQTDARYASVNVDWGREGTSSLTQPPILAYAVWRIYEVDRDAEFLAAMYKCLFHFYQYLLHERDPHQRHLIGIINPDESGEDNSPRFDVALGLPPVHDMMENDRRRKALIVENIKSNFDAPFCLKNFFWVKDVPYNAMMVENLRALARIAERLDRGSDARHFQKQSDEVAAAMKKTMLEDGIYWSTYGERYTKIKVKTWAMFAPLAAGLAEKDEADRLVREHLLNEKEFAAPFSVPTVALDEPSFNGQGFWRGPVWAATNWFIYRGLRNYGYEEEADKVRADTLALLERSGFREYWDPETGDGYGAEEFTWGGLAIDMT